MFLKFKDFYHVDQIININQIVYSTPMGDGVVKAVLASTFADVNWGPNGEQTVSQVHHEVHVPVTLDEWYKAINYVRKYGQHEI